MVNTVASFTFVIHNLKVKEIKSISIIGSGNVATRLSIEFFKKGLKIDSVISRTLENAKTLANKVNASYGNKLNDLSDKSDLYIISLKDDAILNYFKEFNLKEKIVVHTSGSFDTDDLKIISTNYGCFYPMQTFSKDIDVNFENIPLFVESKNNTVLNLLSLLAKKLSNNVHTISKEQRKALHISAIGVNNFTHFILSKTKEYCLLNDLDFNLLQPLLNQTIKVVTNEENPLYQQTGPAKRGDTKIILDHIKHLEENSSFQNIYKELSQQILTEFHGKKHKL